MFFHIAELISFIFVGIIFYVVIQLFLSTEKTAYAIILFITFLLLFVWILFLRHIRHKSELDPKTSPWFSWYSPAPIDLSDIAWFIQKIISLFR